MSQSCEESEMLLLWECFVITELLLTKDYLVIKEKTSGLEPALSFTLTKSAYNRVYCHTSCSFFTTLTVSFSPSSFEYAHVCHYFFAFLIRLQHCSVFLKQSGSRHQLISLAFHHLNCINMMSACHQLNALFGWQADIGPLTARRA